MSAVAFEAFLASIYFDADARARFLAGPQAEARQAGLAEDEVDALANIDRAGLALAAMSYERKREKRAVSRQARKARWTIWGARLWRRITFRYALHADANDEDSTKWHDRAAEFFHGAESIGTVTLFSGAVGIVLLVVSGVLAVVGFSFAHSVAISGVLVIASAAIGAMGAGAVGFAAAMVADRLGYGDVVHPRRGFRYLGMAIALVAGLAAAYDVIYYIYTHSPSAP